jgi:hypothetical protein
MIWIVRSAEDVTAFSHPILLTELLGASFRVVVALTQGRQLVERWETFRHQALLSTAF